ncbi:MAG: tyrosine-protein phosphatase [Paracoccaceae bacterium]|nr:tyrosine-protein phosphatase [Paracoccaceae bacterium]
MLPKLWTRIEEAERRLRHSFGTDITEPHARAWSKLHYHVFDHAFLRVFWTNFWPVAPGVWRSNQPTHARFEKYAQMGIKTVINLRGEDKHAHYLFEKESCDQLGLTLVNAKLWARKAAPRKAILAVIEALRDAEKPFVFHCKSGADRAGFVAALYLMVFEGRSVQEARKQLGLKYIHLEITATGVQDYVLHVYEARLAQGEISFEEWIRTEYRANEMQEGFDGKHTPDQTAAKLVARKK